MAQTENGATVISWGGAARGVGIDKALEVFGGVVGYYDGLQKEGLIAGYRTYASVTGSFSGTLVIEGRLESLKDLLIADETLKHQVLGQAVVEELNTQLYAGGSVDDILPLFAQGQSYLREAGLT